MRFCSSVRCRSSGWDKVEHSLGLQLLSRESKCPLPRGAELQEIAAEVSNTQHVDRQVEKAILHKHGNIFHPLHFMLAKKTRG